MDDLKAAHFLDQLNNLLIETKTLKMNEKVSDFMRPQPHRHKKYRDFEGCH